jgi:hypothetical protein
MLAYYYIATITSYDHKSFRAQATGWISLTLLWFHFYDKTVVASPAYDYLFLLIKSFVLF